MIRKGSTVPMKNCSLCFAHLSLSCRTSGRMLRTERQTPCSGGWCGVHFSDLNGAGNYVPAGDGCSGGCQCDGLKGPTAMGMVEFMSQADTGELTDNNYHFSITAATDEVSAALAQGTTDLAAVPANLASVLYNNTEGGVQVLASTPWACSTSWRTATRFTPWPIWRARPSTASTRHQHRVRAQLSAGGERPHPRRGRDNRVEDQRGGHGLMASGGIDLCMLPVPAATSVMMQNADVRDAIDLNDVWQDVGRRHLYHGLRGGPERLRGGAPGGGGRFLTEYTAPSPM